MVYLTREEHFCAAHRLFNPAWSDEKNQKIFGKCANKNYHGHNYQLHITVSGEPNRDTGYVMDAKLLSDIINKHVIKLLDHKNLNLDVDVLKPIVPTVENLAVAIWDILLPHIKGCQLYRIKLYETSKIYVTYYGK